MGVRESKQSQNIPPRQKHNNITSPRIPTSPYASNTKPTRTSCTGGSANKKRPRMSKAHTHCHEHEKRPTPYKALVIRVTLIRTCYTGGSENKKRPRI